MNKVLLSVLILLILNNCSASKKVGFWDKDNKDQKQIENTKTILTKQIRLEEEFNSNPVSYTHLTLPTIYSV